jgi:hypothetical protein
LEQNFGMDKHDCAATAIATASKSEGRGFATRLEVPLRFRFAVVVHFIFNFNESKLLLDRYPENGGVLCSWACGKWACVLAWYAWRTYKDKISFGPTILLR